MFLLVFCGAISSSKEDSSLILSKINEVSEFTFRVSSYLTAVSVLGNPTINRVVTFEKLIVTKYVESPIVVSNKKLGVKSFRKFDIVILDIMDDWTLVS